MLVHSKELHSASVTFFYKDAEFLHRFSLRLAYACINGLFQKPQKTENQNKRTKVLERSLLDYTMLQKVYTGARGASPERYNTASSTTEPFNNNNTIFNHSHKFQTPSRYPKSHSQLRNSQSPPKFQHNRNALPATPPYVARKDGDSARPHPPQDKLGTTS